MFLSYFECLGIYWQFIRFVQRTEGTDSALKVLVDARKSPLCTYHIYVASAMMVLCLEKDAKVNIGWFYSLKDDGFFDCQFFVSACPQHFWDGAEEVHSWTSICLGVSVWSQCWRLSIIYIEKYLPCQTPCSILFTWILCYVFCEYYFLLDKQEIIFCPSEFSEVSNNRQKVHEAWVFHMQYGS